MPLPIAASPRTPIHGEHRRAGGDVGPRYSEGKKGRILLAVVLHEKHTQKTPPRVLGLRERIDRRSREGSHARRGRLYIEKGDGSPQFGSVNREQWDWPRFTELLADPGRRAALEAAVAQHDLRIGDYIGGGFTPRAP